MKYRPKSKLNLIYKILFFIPTILLFTPALTKATERMICVDDCDSEKLDVIPRKSTENKENASKENLTNNANHDKNENKINKNITPSRLPSESDHGRSPTNELNSTEFKNDNATSLMGSSQRKSNENNNRNKIDHKRKYVDDNGDSESNMPSYYHNLGARQPGKNLNPSNWVLVNDLEVKHIQGLNPGTHAFAQIDADMEITPSVPQPIVARLITGRFQGARLLGSANLDRDLHRVLIHFHSMTIEGETIKIAADTLDYSGKVGLRGEYISEDNALMVGGFLSSFFAGFTESSVERHRNEQGNYVDEPTLSNQVKKGLTTSLSKASERLETRAGQMPGYTVVRGPTQIQVVFDEPEGSVKK
jgi:hypothetical protein